MSSIQRVCRFVLLVVCASAAAFLLTAPASARADDTYAALAFSAKTGKTGIGSNVDSQDKADAAALAQCKGNDAKVDDAKVVVRVKNGWCALAMGGDHKYGVGTGADQDTAKKSAAAECRKVTTFVFVGPTDDLMLSAPSKPANPKITSFLDFPPEK